jgi:hypothetical protein
MEAMDMFKGNLSRLIVTTLGLCTALAAYGVKADEYTPITPCRALDTRDATAIGNGLGAVMVGVERHMFGYDIGLGEFENQGGTPGGCGVPSSATAVHMNISGGLNSTGLGYLRIWPYGEDEPEATILVWQAGVPIANALTVAMSNSGDIEFTMLPYLTDTDLVIEFLGYYTATAPTLSAEASEEAEPVQRLAPYEMNVWK